MWLIYLQGMLTGNGTTMPCGVSWIIWENHSVLNHNKIEQNKTLWHNPWGALWIWSYKLLYELEINTLQKCPFLSKNVTKLIWSANLSLPSIMDWITLFGTPPIFQYGWYIFMMFDLDFLIVPIKCSVILLPGRLNTQLKPKVQHRWVFSSCEIPNLSSVAANSTNPPHKPVPYLVSAHYWLIECGSLMRKSSSRASGDKLSHEAVQQCHLDILGGRWGIIAINTYHKDGMKYTDREGWFYPHPSGLLH